MILYYARMKKEKKIVISELYAQQCKLLRYLLVEITGGIVLDHQKEENARLQGEILDHNTRNVLAQFGKNLIYLEQKNNTVIIIPCI